MNTEVTESVQIDPYNSVFVPGLDILCEVSVV